MDLVVLGVDGVSPDYLEEALEKYDMPGWEELRDEAFYSDLESCVPAVTIPAWVSMFSGYDAGKFGAFHLTQPDFDSWETGLRKTSFPNTCFWDRIKGRSSLHNIPGTSPVYKIDGWMKGGFPSPHDFDFYPEELEQEMNEKFNLEKKDKRKNTLGSKIEAEFENYELERKVADEIMEKDARVSVSVIKMTDTIGHITESKGNILKAYRKTDDAIQKALEKAEEENANLIVASDHGFFRVKKKFNIVSFLAENDLIDVEKAEGETSLAYRLAEPLLDTPVKKYLRKLHVAYNSFTGNRLDGKSGNYLSNIKKSSTVIPYHKGLGKDCLLKIHTEDMEHGTVAESEKEEIIDTVIEKLSNVERNGEKVIEKVWKGGELYTGESPEIAFRTTDKYVVGTTNAHRNFSKTNALTHHETGIFFAKGPNIHEEADEELEDLFDVAPLIYAVLGEKIPNDLRGSVPENLVTETEIEKGSPEIEQIDV